MRATYAKFADRVSRIGFRTMPAIHVCFALALVSILWHQARSHEQVVRQTTIQEAAERISVLTAFRSIYTSEVVARLSGHGVEVRHDYTEQEGAIPLPATLTIILGKRMVSGHTADGVRLYSPYPFPWRKSTGGLRDDFARTAWDKLTKNPERPFFRFETSEKGNVLRYAKADRMREACVQCHNNHPQTPKRDWKVGDVRGVLEVDVAVAKDPGFISTVSNVLPLLTILFVLGIACMWIVTADERRRAATLERRVEERTAKLEAEKYERVWTAKKLKITVRELEMQKHALDQSAIVSATNVHGTITYVNDTFCAISGYTHENLLGKNHRILKSGEHSAAFYEELWRTISGGHIFRAEIKNRKIDGNPYWINMTIVPFMKPSGKPYQYIAISVDITKRKLSEQRLLALTSDLNKAHKAMEADKQKLQEDLATRKKLEVELVQARKLEAVGQLAAGIAHEINTPTQYIGDNTRFLEDSFRELAPLLVKAGELAEIVRQDSASRELADDLKSALADADVDYLALEIPRAIGQSLEGIERVRKIVHSLKEFSHPGDGDKKQLVDLNRAIDSTITVATNEWKYVAEMKTYLDPELPWVPCLQGEFNQVVLNLIVNAAHAIADVVGDSAMGKGTITVSTCQEGEFVEIRITDTGTGIPEMARGKIFDPFFTTKAVGKGTGQGLSIAHSVVVKKHAGTIDFETEIGKGTTFIIRLPLASEDTV